MSHIYLYLYIALSVLTTTAASIERGSRYDHISWDDYDIEDFFIPLLLGALAPLTILTAFPYILGIRGRKYLADRRIRKEREQKRLAKEQEEKDKALAPHMPEVEKALMAHK